VTDAMERVARAAAVADRARVFARNRITEHVAERLHAECGEVLTMSEALADVQLIEDEIASAFVMGWAARDDETAAGRLPRPRQKRK